MITIERKYIDGIGDVFLTGPNNEIYDFFFKQLILMQINLLS